MPAGSNSTRNDANDSEEASSESLRWDTLTGFQRDILRALYVVDAEKRDLTDNAERGYVASYDVRHQLADFPAYTDDTVDSSRFYPATGRLQERGWITIQPVPREGDTRRRQYELAPNARPLIESALNTDATILEQTEDGHVEQATLPDGGDSDV